MLMEFDDNKIVGQYIVAVNITESDVENIIVNALEGASNYWVGINNSLPEWKDKPTGIDGVPVSQWATKLLLEGKTVHLYDCEDESETWELTLEKLLKGFELNAINRPAFADKESFDGSDVDCVLQYALFGKIVYG